MTNRILSEHRRSFGDFAAVDFVDEQEVSTIRGKIDVDVPLDLHWTWEYASEVEELRNLYERGKKGQWNAETDIDWSQPFPRDEWFMPREGALLLPSILTAMGADEDTCRRAAFDEFAHLLSQLLHGEQAAMQLCGQLTNACPTMDAKFYAGSQVIDEVRHVEVLSKFLQRKMGTLYPIDPTLKILLDMLLEAPTWKMKTLGMQTLFEGMAVGIFDTIAKATTNPLLKDLIRRVQIDESRHAAFGILSMRQVVKDSSPEELQEMEDFAFGILEALNANQQLDMLRLLGPKYGLDPENVVQSALAMPEWPALNSEIFMHTVMPNLKRLNLITERTEPEYRRIGMIYGDRFDAGHELSITN
ncbi:MAG TPA: ferritin-like domain-containing protein [Candidatus Acidoferrales bacterium]|nr:ferritin-like domain-containing protein [Candidatus Acidoferrales bacterium]